MISSALLRKISPRGKAAIIDAVAPALDKYMVRYEIDTPLRASHFLAQAAHECDSFRTLEEYASGRAYEGRKDLGNVNPGDGVRFKGRGIFQLTGRVNYAAYGKRLKLDLVNNPLKAASPDVSVRVACEYWKAKGLNAWADRDDIKEITRRINGGYNGLSDRKAYLVKAKAALGGHIPAKPTIVAEPVEEVPDAPIAAERSKTGVTEGGALAGAGTAVDTLTTANDVISKVSETKESAEKLGAMDYAGALLTNPRFLISAAILIAIVGGIIVWQIRKRR